MQNNCTLKEIGALLLSKNRILIISHSRPDGDTLGCAFALKNTLEGAGKDVVVFCVDSVQPRLRFLTDGKENLTIPDSFEPELICTVDVANTDMLKSAEEMFGSRIDIAIDHHGTNPGFAKLNYVDSTAAACCEIIYTLIDECDGLDFSGATLDCLYTGIASDTGCFQYSNTTAKTHRIVAELIDRGVNYKEINHALFETKTRSELVCNRVALTNLTFHQDGLIGLMAFSLADKAEYGITDDDISAYAALPREVEGVICGISLRQFEENKFKASLRSGLEFDVSKVSTFFGGGGHHSAAGCTITASDLDHAKEMVLGRVILEMKDQGAI